MENIKLRIGIDIGGTFTDAIAVSDKSISTAKVPSRPDQPGAAVLAALEVLNLDGIPDRFLHGTTLVTNMLLERKGAKTDFITSDGGFVLESVNFSSTGFERIQGFSIYNRLKPRSRFKMAIVHIDGKHLNFPARW